MYFPFSIRFPKHSYSVKIHPIFIAFQLWVVAIFCLAEQGRCVQAQECCLCYFSPVNDFQFWHRGHNLWVKEKALEPWKVFVSKIFKNYAALYQGPEGRVGVMNFKFIVDSKAGWEQWQFSRTCRGRLPVGLGSFSHQRSRTLLVLQQDF